MTVETTQELSGSRKSNLNWEHEVPWTGLLVMVAEDDHPMRKCSRCKDKIHKGEQYRAHPGKVFNRGKELLCISCIGFILSRYSFHGLSPITQAEKQMMDYWTEEVVKKFRKW